MNSITAERKVMLRVCRKIIILLINISLIEFQVFDFSIKEGDTALAFRSSIISNHFLESHLKSKFGKYFRRHKILITVKVER